MEIGRFCWLHSKARDGLTEYLCSIALTFFQSDRFKKLLRRFVVIIISAAYFGFRRDGFADDDPALTFGFFKSFYFAIGFFVVAAHLTSP